MLEKALGQGFSAPYLLVDAWFTSPKFCQGVKELGLHVIGRLKRDRTLYYWDGGGASTLDQLYQAPRHRLVKVPTLGLSLLQVAVTCSNGLKGAIVLTKGYKFNFRTPHPNGLSGYGPAGQQPGGSDRLLFSLGVGGRGKLLTNPGAFD